MARVAASFSTGELLGCAHKKLRCHGMVRFSTLITYSGAVAQLRDLATFKPKPMPLRRGMCGMHWWSCAAVHMHAFVRSAGGKCVTTSVVQMVLGNNVTAEAMRFVSTSQ